MLIDYHADGSINIDFGEATPITVKPPKFGAMKRLRAEREKYAREAQDEIAKLPDPAKVKDPTKAAEQSRQNTAATEEINLGRIVRWWQFLFFGDDSFQGLASPKPPADPDDWPAALLYDIRDFPRDADGKIDIARMELPLIDKLFAHWGKAR